MAKTYVNVIKKDAVINVPFTTNDIVKLQAILLKHLDKKVSIDDESWNTLEELCDRIDQNAINQDKMESKEVSF
jgi:hypothetical protein